MLSEEGKNLTWRVLLSYSELFAYNIILHDNFMVEIILD